MFLAALFLGMATFAFLAGTGDLQRWRSARKIASLPAISPSPKESKSFAIILYAHNASLWCERALHSIFSQEYEAYRVLFIDDGSIDGTFERAQQFILDNNQAYRVIAVRNDTELGPLASLSRIVRNCLDREILVPLDATQWFAHERVLSRLNQALQAPDVRIVWGQTIQYPSYEITTRPSQALAFYADLFKRAMPLEEQSFALLLDQAEDSTAHIEEPLVFVNLAAPLRGRCPRAPNKGRSPL